MEPIDRNTNRPPGVCLPWQDIKPELPPIQGDEKLFQQIWQETDSLAYTYIWQLLLSF